MIDVPSAGGAKTFTDTTTGGTNVLGGGCAASDGTDAREIVYEWTPDKTGSATIETCNATLTKFDTVIYARDACPLPVSAGNEITNSCNNDGAGGTCDAFGLPGKASKASFNVTLGTTVYIVVDGLNGAVPPNGPYALKVTPP